MIVFCMFRRLFGFVARKLGGGPTDNACHVFAELEAEQPAEAVTSFVMKVMLGHGRRRTWPDLLSTGLIGWLTVGACWLVLGEVTRIYNRIYQVAEVQSSSGSGVVCMEKMEQSRAFPDFRRLFSGSPNHQTPHAIPSLTSLKCHFMRHRLPCPII